VIVAALRRALDRGVPVVAFLESAGARIQEGVSALGGFARVFYQNVALSTRVPQISVVTDTAAGGGCYSPALTDFVVMTERANMFLTGPRIVHDALGEDVTADGLGGAHVHERNGVCQFVAPHDRAAIETVRTLLAFLPGRAGAPAPRSAGAPPAAGDPAAPVPTERRKVYDVREVARRILDDGSVLEVAPRWARNLVTAFARLDGRPVGLVANQPRQLGGVLDVDASQKGARFVHICDAYGLPLVVLVDTPGFMPGSRQESRGVIRYGAQLVRAFASANVRRCTVILRNAYGGAYISMNCKDLGADRVFAWPQAQIGIMSPHSAVRVIHRRQLDGADAQRVATVVEDYTRRHLSAYIASDLGLIDGIITPDRTRSAVLATLCR
jgi:acetyl-CoA carboxylase carboxyltransferase component